jgi:hypothetical protein
MSQDKNKTPMDQWSLLFGDPKDQTLSSTTRNECLALFTQNEIMSRGFSSEKDESPRKKIFMERADMIEQLPHATNERKVEVQSMLCMDYLSSKHSTSTAKTAELNISRHYEPVDTSLSQTTFSNSAMSSTLTPPLDILTRMNTKKMNSCIEEHLDSHVNTVTNTHPPMVGNNTNALWSKSTTTLEFHTRWQAIHHLGPWITSPKTLRVKGFYVCEYRCAELLCPARMRLRSEEEGWFVPASIDYLCPHNHDPCDWVTHYRLIIDPKRKTKKPKAGLPPLVKAITEQFSLEPDLGPNDVFRKIYTIFRLDPLWSQADTRKILKKQVNQRTRSIRRKSPNQISIVFTQDLLRFKETHKLCLPGDHVAQPVSNEIHLAELARRLEQRGYLRGRKFQKGVPHQDLIVLQYSESIQNNSRFRELVAKRKKEFVLANTVVFSSLALLWNICGDNDLDWQVCGGADGTFNCCSNDYKLIGIGLFSINTDGTKRFHPLVYALAQGEIELVALIALHHLKEASQRIFGLTPRFKGGLVSDHTEVFTNAFHSIFPEDQLLQCFPHIIRKFRIDGAREGNGAYYRYLSGKNKPSWLNEVAENDVYQLRECRTDAMFRTMATLVLEAWTDAGENDLCETFKASYLMKPQFNTWYYCASGIPGCIPQNNSHERSNLDTKGCSNFRGIINQGRNMTKMMNVEFPKLIYVNSSERVSTVRHYPILDKKKTLTTPLFEYYNKVDMATDVVKFGDGYLVNKDIALGNNINIDMYVKTMNGKFEGTFENRHLFVERVDDLCFVRKHKLSSKHPEMYCGSCFDFYNHLSCHHAAIFQYKSSLPELAHKIPQSRGSNERRRKKGKDRIQRAIEKRQIRTDTLGVEAKTKKTEGATLLEVFPRSNENKTIGQLETVCDDDMSEDESVTKMSAVPITQTEE